MSIKANALPEYLGCGDPALKDYYPAWLDNMADDATVEGSMLDGVVQGAEAVRSVVLTIRSLYDRQEHKFAGPYNNNAFLEDYVLRCTASLSAASCWSPLTSPGRPSTSWRVTGHAARCCSFPFCWVRSSRAPPLPSTSPTGSPETGRNDPINVMQLSKASMR